jgi:dihydropteroate synthase
VTPDSFSDGGSFVSGDQATAHADRMVREGADGIDVGGESTRPGAIPVDADAEIRRVVPVLEQLRRRHPDVLLSVDTVKAEVARAALAAGADVVNDVSGFRLDPRMGEIVATARAGAILMHSRGTVADMASYAHADYGADMVAEVGDELQWMVERAVAAGVAREALVVDPGIGFSKRSSHSLRLLGQLSRLVERFDRPLLVGVSRKRFLGEITGEGAPAARMAGSVGANVAALGAGARLFRVHDVRPHRQALDVAWAIARSGATAPEPVPHEPLDATSSETRATE